MDWRQQRQRRKGRVSHVVLVRVGSSRSTSSEERVPIPFSVFSWLWLTGSKQRLAILLCFGPLPLLPPSQHTEGEVISVHAHAD